ncbi:MAG: hypothetical protein HZB38_11060 [Planctomycetes bacterium]|nr:hypothetical protein [Planctomycetota bacterium]
MRFQSSGGAAIVGAVLSCAGTAPFARSGPIIDQGWDLLFTRPDGTNFAGSSWQGVPIGDFWFDTDGDDVTDPGEIRDASLADTIVHRTAGAAAPSTVVPLRMEALRLRSVTPIDLGAGLDFYYVTLQSDRGGPVSGGSMNIVFGPEGDPHGTFTSAMDVFFDVRSGALNGPIVMSGMDHIISNAGGPAWWRHEAVPGALLLPGVNFLLNGVDDSHDFFPGAHEQGGGEPCTFTFLENGQIVTHKVASCIPEPSTAFMLLAMGIVALAGGETCLRFGASNSRRRAC